MARRRLLSILTASALFTVALAGPAAAIGVTDDPEDSVVEVTEESVEVAGTAVEEVVTTVDAEPVDELADEVEETVAPQPAPSSSRTPTPEPSPTRSQEPAPAPTGSDEPLVAAGNVAPAPSLASLTGTGGSAPAPRSGFDLPLAAPTSTSAAPATTDVEAPLVAPPAEVAAPAAPSVLAQPASSAVPDEGTPVLALVALASLLAAGSATVREARVTATA